MKQHRHKGIGRDRDKRGEGPCLEPCPPLQLQFQLKQLACSNLQLETNFQDPPDHWGQSEAHRHQLLCTCARETALHILEFLPR